MAMSHFMRFFYVIEMRQTSQFCAGGGGKIKITMADIIVYILSAIVIKITMADNI